MRETGRPAEGPGSLRVTVIAADGVPAAVAWGADPKPSVAFKVPLVWFQLPRPVQRSYPSTRLPIGSDVTSKKGMLVPSRRMSR